MARETVETIYSAKGNHEKYLDGIIGKQTSFIASSAKAAVAITGVTVVTKKLIDFGLKSIEFTNKQIEADTRLETISKRVTGATNDQIQSVKDLAAAYQEITTVGNEATEIGQSQLASFGLTTEAVKDLTGSLLDLGVATYGVDVNSDELIQTANMLGKAYTGQSGALSRVGVLLDDQQTKTLQNGNEAERLAALIEIVEQNYGGLAEALTDTPEGKIKQLENEFNDLREEVGESFLPVAFEAKKAQLELADAFFNGGQDVDEFTNALVKGIRAGNIMGQTALVIAEGTNAAAASVARFFIASTKFNPATLALRAISDEYDMALTKADAFLEGIETGSTESLEKRMSKLLETMEGFNDEVDRSERRSSDTGGGGGGGGGGETDEAIKAYEELVKKRAQAFQEIKTFSIAEQDRERAAVNNHFIELLELFEGAGEQANSIRESINEEWLLQLGNINTREIEEEQRKEDEKLRIRQEAEEQRRALVIDSLNTIDAVSGAIEAVRMARLEKETQSKIDAVNATTKSEKEKAKEIKKIEEEALKERQKIALAQWGVDLATSIANTALGVTAASTMTPWPVAVAAMASTAVAGTAATATIAANKPRFAHGSVDASGQLRQIPHSFGGGGVDSEIGVFSPNELIVPPKDAQAALNGINGTGGGSSITTGDVNVTIQGNADESVIAQIPELVNQGVARALENRDFENVINPFLV